ncbi:Fe2+-dependent dioxygenase [Corallococcus exiguus]|uniref:Fe2+-dependent dioxygenase n=1 Tax=Corallococcus exiguus TaxID=83462 RepID=A0A7X4YF88_9BACT|nr:MULTISPECIES: Fe2+-dependent dioxygenase [Corallococcus]NBC43639.1 Fe2+-dependent dioxygenase [Corallococcus exiguus]NNC20733.1 Fe2+-dependent dioxygenase [Corallococcus exiguus]NRD58171.1 Fe2+-dependent dioxygenase [Corallococcus exiguus]NRD63719.1 Fe2+-dependent dioxygenase [Corallococcus exiguus]RKH17604.1 Fe2+-dependent dioxygenase [Corallococcus sp. CA041A]
MMVHIPQVLTPEQVAHCRAVFDKAAWEDGRTTAGKQSMQVKKNLQLPEGSPAARELGDLVLAGLEKSPLFISAVLPQRVFPPLFNRYESGMDFGSHVDNAIRPILGTNQRIRTDVSATLFLSDPDSYDGGELVVEDTYGNHAAKLPAGDLIVYPSTSLHHVTPVTRGVRLASFFWIQSMIRDAGQRSLLFDMDTSIMQLTREVPKSPALVMLTGVYHNLLRQWAEP